MRTTLLVVALAGCGGAATPAPAPAPAPTPTIADADALLAAGRAADAAAAYDAIAAARPVGIPVRVRAAIAHAQAGDLDRALAWLERALAGGAAPQILERRPELAAAIADPRWQALREAAPAPCAGPEHRALDFWVGTWDVFDGAGTLVGRNVIEVDLGGCMVHESWTGAGGDRGRSLNLYDPARRAWQQHWVDAGGRLIHYEGNLDRAGAMIFEGTNVLRDGTPAPSRMRLEPRADGTVLQRIETSNDDGATWEVGFEAIYRRAP